MSIAEPIHALGFSPWKRTHLRRFLSGERVRFVSRIDQVPAGARVAAWASGPHREAVSIASERQGSLAPIWIEDGFLRSVGLGADLVRPLSWVIDRTGIYYDSTRPSDLENLLQTGDFPAELLARAGALQESLLAAGLTKYNVGPKKWAGLSDQAASRSCIVLVPGQVESDASIRMGAPGIRRNIELLREARQMNPDAWLVYKPHPDVVAGLREAGKDETEAGDLCNEIVTDAPMNQVLECVDIVHVLTSLTGFEALLRGKQVVCHGLPFYAGWGLTRDLWTSPRRTRRLSLPELVAGALILYPTYVSRISQRPCAVEQAVAELSAWQRTSKAIPRWRQWIRPLLRRV